MKLKTRFFYTKSNQGIKNRLKIDSSNPFKSIIEEREQLPMFPFIWYSIRKCDWITYHRFESAFLEEIRKQDELGGDLIEEWIKEILEKYFESAVERMQPFQRKVRRSVRNNELVSILDLLVNSSFYPILEETEKIELESNSENEFKNMALIQELGERLSPVLFFLNFIKEKESQLRRGDIRKEDLEFIETGLENIKEGDSSSYQTLTNSILERQKKEFRELKESQSSWDYKGKEKRLNELNEIEDLSKSFSNPAKYTRLMRRVNWLPCNIDLLKRFLFNNGRVPFFLRKFPAKFLDLFFNFSPLECWKKYYFHYDFKEFWETMEIFNIVTGECENSHFLNFRNLLSKENQDKIWGRRLSKKKLGLKEDPNSPEHLFKTKVLNTLGYGLYISLNIPFLIWSNNFYFFSKQKIANPDFRKWCCCQSIKHLERKFSDQLLEFIEEVAKKDTFSSILEFFEGEINPVQEHFEKISEEFRSFLDFSQHSNHIFSSEPRGELLFKFLHMQMRVLNLEKGRGLKRRELALLYLNYMEPHLSELNDFFHTLDSINQMLGFVLNTDILLPERKKENIE